jgi:hypothetical protein
MEDFLNPRSRSSLQLFGLAGDRKERAGGLLASDRFGGGFHRMRRLEEVFCDDARRHDRNSNS